MSQKDKNLAFGKNLVSRYARNNFTNRAYQVVKQISKGKVATYGQIAAKLGKPKAARAVGNALHKNPHKSVPCHRVVNWEGRVATNFGHGGWREQKRKLSEEGVKFKDERRVNLEKHLTSNV